MKALVYTGRREVVYRDEPDPEPGPGEVLVRVDAAGICGSDMHAWRGHDSRRVPPLILGHEAAGTVLDGPDEGAKVFLNPSITCGRCDYCVCGRSNLCVTRALIGLHRPGALAEMVAVPERNLMPLPMGFDPAKAPLTEPCATAWHAISRGARAHWRPLPEAAALVIGGGSVGLLGALVLRHFGAKGVRLGETNPLRRATVESNGIDVFDPVNTPAAAESADFVFDAVGSAATRAAAVTAVKRGGVIVHVGIQEPGGAFDARTVTLLEVTFVGANAYIETDLRAALEALHEGVLGPLDFTEERPLADGVRAFHDLDDGATAAAKVILCPHGPV